MLGVWIWIVVLATAAACSADTVDSFPVLTTLDGQSYTNAEITRVTVSYAIVLFDGGGKKIPLSQLPVELQKKYHFDPAAAAAAEQAEIDKRLAEQRQAQAQLAEFFRSQGPTGDAVKVHVLKVLQPYQYQVSVAGAEQTITMNSMPQDVMDFIQRRDSLHNSITNLQSQIESQRQYAANQAAIAKSMKRRSSGYAAQNAVAKQANAEVQQQQRQLTALQAELDKLNKADAKNTTILARPTDKVPVWGRIWLYVGMAPETPPEKADASPQHLSKKQASQ
ncbi:MAG: hypothetical protein ABSG59_08465 [Verrucomicrobiota bacterium]|jgi:hypothetical protein